MQQTGQQATDAEVEMVTAMLRIASDIDRLDQLSDQHPLPASALRATPALLQTAEGLRARAEQTAHFKRCPVLRQLIEDDHQRRRNR
ncbi:hypothetical protein [Streptomyces syringium]|uniref:hypothetical protein n=1 Tax=Streptomyces syringium TaxID=76729 RepID=UPI003AADF94D